VIDNINIKLTPDEYRRLLQALHPDKHYGKSADELAKMAKAFADLRAAGDRAEAEEGARQARERQQEEEAYEAQQRAEQQRRRAEAYAARSRAEQQQYQPPPEPPPYMGPWYRIQVKNGWFGDWVAYDNNFLKTNEAMQALYSARRQITDRRRVRLIDAATGRPLPEMRDDLLHHMFNPIPGLSAGTSAWVVSVALILALAGIAGIVAAIAPHAEFVYDQSYYHSYYPYDHSYDHVGQVQVPDGRWMTCAEAARQQVWDCLNSRVPVIVHQCGEPNATFDCVSAKPVSSANIDDLPARSRYTAK